MNKKKYALLLLLSFSFVQSLACSIFYYRDSRTGKLYFVNNEDYYYDVKPYIQVVPSSSKVYGRIWYGWERFAQGGVNEKGLVLDGAVTENSTIPEGYNDTQKGNITDELLAKCANVEEAVQFLENRKIALKNAHIFLGDRNGRAVVLEWVNAIKYTVELTSNRLVVTNFNLSDTSRKEITCMRYKAVQAELDALEKRDSVNFKHVANAIGKAVQLPNKDAQGREGGTLYSSFIDLTEMQLILVYKLDNSKLYRFDVIKEVALRKKKKIMLN